MDTLRDCFLAGLGLGLRTKEHIEQEARKAFEHSDAFDELTGEYFEQMSNQAEKARNTLEKFVEKQVFEAVNKAGIAKTEDIRRLEQRVEELEKLIKEQAG
jgi:polyhydroxyalkanoate synthesis regulator phasin